MLLERSNFVVYLIMQYVILGMAD